MIRRIILALFLFSVCAEASTPVAGTRYPIVLIHGLFGYSNKTALLFDYWGDVPQLLTAHGARVYVADVSQAHTIEKRGEQLYEQLLLFGHRRYHLIGHSQGGLDARYVLENYPDIVASVTTISTPHHGSKVADYLVEKMLTNTFFDAFSRIAGNLLGYLLSFLSGNLREQDVVHALKDLTTIALKDFNALYPHGINADCEDGPSTFLGRRLYSWGSYGPVVRSRFDWFGKIMIKASHLFDRTEYNDGLVSLCSMKFGTWLGTGVGGHHLMPVGGIVSPISNEHYEWSHGMFLEHAKRLKSTGL